MVALHSLFWSSALLAARTFAQDAGTASPAPAADADSADAPVSQLAIKTATVTSPAGTFIGNVINNVESYGGIPYAQAPVGPLRLRPPQRITGNLGTRDVTGPAAACPQFVVSNDSKNVLFDLLGDIAGLPFVQDVTGQTEDCLTVTIARPAGTKADAKLPVLFWIFGGGFELGWTSMYDGSSLVNYGVSIGEPFVFVAVNYRVAGWGFMPGKEIKADGSGNLGLRDQRMGLEWVADNIASFGGDPDKVTIWGESAGSISVFDQMALYGGQYKYKNKPLFRGAIMSSGSIVPTEAIDSNKGQIVYDKVVATAGCSGAADTLNCLRGLSYADFYRAVTSVPGLLSYQSLALSYLPRPDGDTLPQSPHLLADQGLYAPVPFIIGDQEDEGTLFGIFQPNLTSPADLVDYLKAYYFQRATKADLAEYVATYDTGIAAVVDGSPHRTGLLNEIFPGFKRRAAVLGDLVFTLSRRVMLQHAQRLRPSVPFWSYLASQNYGTPVLGSLHGGDILQVFLGVLDNYAARSQRAYYINFLYNLDPNVGKGGYPSWPKWMQGKQLMQFFKGSSSLLSDDFRKDSSDWLSLHIDELLF
ncbi:carboxylesterase [Microdochium trichocladiopsis]|uniref:Carboxylic ester hydrolase n=1 Tax=Microdochium trichocladiopsis TaxID=1682393 RepID=A0A9P8Y1G0_9PEZI|nr:carboxylesterase [Microdochium trichocladiopsis]KAH7025071.1 carboxylesterase [Microdochium trichocladiopsis]